MRNKQEFFSECIYHIFLATHRTPHIFSQCWRTKYCAQHEYLCFVVSRNNYKQVRSQYPSILWDKKWQRSNFGGMQGSSCSSICTPAKDRSAVRQFGFSRRMHVPFDLWTGTTDCTTVMVYLLLPQFGTTNPWVGPSGDLSYQTELSGV
jgi:hypothetical protein